jgi:exosortase D (VPLPA-CTERM-specific)
MPWTGCLRKGCLLAAGIILLYGPTLSYLFHDWWYNPDYSHGFFIPPIAAFFLWRKRKLLRSLPRRPASFGLLVALGSQVIFLVACLGAEPFLQRVSLLILIAGAVLYLRGWRALWEVSFVLLLLLLAIPLPAIIFNVVALPLQLVASSLAERLLDLCRIPVFRDGNLLEISSQTLNVTEACSGIRSLATLVTGGVIVGYFLPARWWLRPLFVFSSIPIALGVNALRVAGTGVLAQTWGERWATGFLHLFSGWVIFIFASCLLLGERQLLQCWFGEKGNREQVTGNRAKSAESIPCSLFPTHSRLLILTGIVALSFGVRLWLGGAPVIPQRQALADFPRRLGPWELAREGSMSGSLEGVLAADDYLLRTYRNAQGQSADLFVAYYKVQNAGESMHSPKNCMPGEGWEPLETSRIRLGADAAGRPLWVNRIVIEKDRERALVLYWYQAHGRVIASEYWGKIYLVWDALRYHQRDGAIVRVTVPIASAGDPETALRLALDLARLSSSHLPQFLPG